MPPYLEISRVSINILINIWASVAGSAGSQVRLFIDIHFPGGREDISDLDCGEVRGERQDCWCFPWLGPDATANTTGKSPLCSAVQAEDIMLVNNLKLSLSKLSWSGWL